MQLVNIEIATIDNSSVAKLSEKVHIVHCSYITGSKGSIQGHFVGYTIHKSGVYRVVHSIQFRTMIHVLHNIMHNFHYTYSQVHMNNERKAV